jgi:hypothetical protein
VIGGSSIRRSDRRGSGEADAFRLEDRDLLRPAGALRVW